MTEQMLLRLAMILQDQAPSTLDKYICKLAESILAESSEALTIDEICETINCEYNLDFTDAEVSTALHRKGAPHIVFIDSDSKPVLSPKNKETIQQALSLSDKLHTIISEFSEISHYDIEENRLFDLLLNYLYACFNTNVDNLLALFDKKVVPVQHTVFEASSDEVAVINEFITWDNKEKDSIIYHIVATCYEYCMLTIKKDGLLSRELFKGKRFYLDSNIIFRMAGINNEERQFVTKSFEKHCTDAGIELICTSGTVDEIYRVIGAEVDHIRSIAGLDMPVSCAIIERLNPALEINDFYKRYYEWCQLPGNRYGDYTSFCSYLFDLVHKVLSNLTIKASNPYKVGKKANDYEEQVKSLIDYKNKRKWRSTTRNSAETDITNIMDLLKERAGNGNSIWQTNDFIVSADHRLIEWANEIYPGVPLVVLPSVWLSIILRYTGRTDDDYKSFCLFLTQRQRQPVDDPIDSTLLLKVINERTNKTELKERIIAEITRNKSQYSFSSVEEYSLSTDKAFDSVLAEYDEKTQKEMILLRTQLQAQHENETNTLKEGFKDKEISAALAEQEKTLLLLASKRAKEKTRVFSFLSKNGWIAYVVGGIALLFCVFTWVFEWEPAFSWGLAIIPEKVKDSTEVFAIVWTILSVAIGTLVVGIGKSLSLLGSSQREKKLRDRFFKKYIADVRNKENIVEP